jgi:hypothetical protein
MCSAELFSVPLCIPSFSHFTYLQETNEEVQLVQAFLLNDSLMVASHIRRRKGPVRYKFQALYELDNMAVVEVKDSDTLQNAFKILMFPDSHLYQAESPDLKQTWIGLLEDTKQKHKISRDALKREMSARSSQFHHQPQPPSSLHYGHMSSSHPLPANMGLPSLPPRPSREPLRDLRSMMQQTSETDHRHADIMAVDWLKDAPENLDVCIAQRDFDKAVELIDSTKCYLKNFSDSHALRDVRARINHRITQLSTVLMKELESSPSGSLRGGPRAARRAVGLLIKLGHATKACELFLLNHQCIIRHDLDDVKNEEGANILYVGNMSAVFFCGLKNAAIEFRRAFCSNNGSYSSFIVWCINELQAFCKRCGPIIFTKMPLTTVTECLVVIRKECDSLHAIGLDLGFKVMQNFHTQILEALSNTKEDIINQCSLSATPEKWQPLDLENNPPLLAAIVMEMENIGVKDFKNKIRGGVIDLSQTTIAFCRLVFNFVDDVQKLYIPELLISFFECFSDIFRHMVNLYSDAFSRDENVPASDCIVTDAQFVVETFLPTVGKSITEWTSVQISDFVDLHDSLLSRVQQLTESNNSPEKNEDSEDSVA